MAAQRAQTEVMGRRGHGPDEPPRRGEPPAWLQERLFERRIVFITGRLDDIGAARAAAEVMTLDATGDAPIDVYLDSADGTLEAAFTLIDTLDLLRASVRIHCRGQVGGPAIGVAAVADYRVALPHTHFRLTQPTSRFAGTPDEIARRNQHQQNLLWRFQARLARATGHPVEEVADDLRRGCYLDAREALDYGLIDAISTTATAPS